MQDMKETIGKNIRRLRKERGQTLKSLSNQIGFTYQQLSRIEHGWGTSAETLERIATILGVDLATLMKESEEDLQNSIPQTKNYVPDKVYQAICARILDTAIKPANDAVIDAFMADIIKNIVQNPVLMRNRIAIHAGIKPKYQFTNDELFSFVQLMYVDFADYAMRISKNEYSIADNKSNRIEDGDDSE